MEIVRSIYATGCWDSGGDPAQALRYLDDDFEFRNPPYAVLSAPRYGHDGFIEAMVNLSEAFDSWHHEPLELTDLGKERVLVQVRFQAHGERSELTLSKPEWHLWRLRSGKATRVQWFTDRTDADHAATPSD
ncbi:MAG: nuclear transport factor 2 family protein [Thermoleophilaceae bacterium]|nr:nuclear transport factor 2 family protein [Thermoleophilaceae bacterium]